ncbi:translation initiation factor [Vicingaceae bacterium]|nr:translation initiation factor [Vicingaceae bacterium]
MGRKIKNNRVVYSTNPDFSAEPENEEQETVSASEQLLEVHLDKKNRGGKVAVVVKNFIGSDDDLKVLGKSLKASCGVGGSAKDGEIIIQGDSREKVMELLSKKGFKTKRVGS